MKEIVDLKKNVVLAIFDQNLKFIGYKADSFWSLAKEFGKIHRFGEADRLIQNYISSLKDQEKENIFSYKSSPENDFVYVSFASPNFENDYGFNDSALEALNSKINFETYCVIDKKLNIYKIDDNPTFSNPENFTKFLNKQEIIHFN
jgi:hypothetical protein